MGCGVQVLLTFGWNDDTIFLGLVPVKRELKEVQFLSHVWKDTYVGSNGKDGEHGEHGKHCFSLIMNLDLHYTVLALTSCFTYQP